MGKFAASGAPVPLMDAKQKIRVRQIDHQLAFSCTHLECLFGSHNGAALSLL